MTYTDMLNMNGQLLHPLQLLISPDHTECFLPDEELELMMLSMNMLIELDEDGKYQLVIQCGDLY